MRSILDSAIALALAGVSMTDGLATTPALASTAQLATTQLRSLTSALRP